MTKKARFVMGIVLIILSIFIAVVGWVSDFLLLNLFAAAPLFIIGAQFLRGKLK